jgi:hypothetical protein
MRTDVHLFEAVTCRLGTAGSDAENCGSPQQSAARRTGHNLFPERALRPRRGLCEKKHELRLRVVDLRFLRGYITSSLIERAVERARGAILATQVEVAYVLPVSFFPASQLLAMTFTGNDFYWLGLLPAGTFKAGGCRSLFGM